MMTSTGLASIWNQGSEGTHDWIHISYLLFEDMEYLECVKTCE